MPRFFSVSFLACVVAVSAPLVSGAALADTTGTTVDTEIQNFQNEGQRQLYYQLVEELRCPKCQNQNLAGSNSQISIDLRNQVARLVRENQNEEQIKQYMVNRYGEFVLYEPPLNKGTLLLWFGPVAMALLGGLVFVVSVMARKKNKDSVDETISQGEGET